MSIEDNKALVLQWVECWNKNDSLALGTLYSDQSFTWRISGLSPVSGKFSKSEIVAVIGQTFAVPMQKKLFLTVRHLTAEDDRVAMEAEQHGVYANGTVFHNYYHILFTIADGKIIRGRAYLDTWQAINSQRLRQQDEGGQQPAAGR